MNVIICGGRDYDRPRVVGAVLDRLAERFGLPDAVFSGCAKGADQLGKQWARSRDVDVEWFPAQWKALGKAAGPIRNQQMLDAGADAVVAFPGGRGTEDMISKAEDAGVTVIKVTE